MGGKERQETAELAASKAWGLAAIGIVARNGK